jgi:hypothetical protein
METGIDTSGPNRKRESLSNGRPKLALRNRRPLNYALTRGHGVNEISKMIEELIHNGKNSKKLGTQIARYERGMFIFSRESG